jgi:hypothetical protein
MHRHARLTPWRCGEPGPFQLTEQAGRRNARAACVRRFRHTGAHGTSRCPPPAALCIDPSTPRSPLSLPAKRAVCRRSKHDFTPPPTDIRGHPEASAVGVRMFSGMFSRRPARSQSVPEYLADRPHALTTCQGWVPQVSESGVATPTWACSSSPTTSNRTTPCDCWKRRPGAPATSSRSGKSLLAGGWPRSPCKSG